jgi:alpha-tubulin suppressor-like RCC1 family protein
VYLGQQGYNINFLVSNVTFSSPPLFTFNAAVQDLTTEPIGTADGRTPAPDSVIVFLYEAPVTTTGSGVVTLTNAPDTGLFINPNEPYFQYPGLLPSNATSISLPWNFNVPATVQRFSFEVDITAQVPDTTSGALSIPPHQFNTLAVGEAHTCAIRPTNHDYCWGFDEYGAIGILAGAPQTTARGVLGMLLFNSISAGSEFSCGVTTTSGASYCWGDNLSGEVGDGTSIDRGEPTALGGSLDFSTVAAGNEYACGLVAGTAYCWGDNYLGQLGDGTTSPHATPQQVTGGLQFADIAAGSFHACGLTSGGVLYCWGANTSGELGNGGTTSSSAPVVVSGSLHFEAVAAGNAFTCALDLTGKAYCWGANTYGAVGNGSSGNMLTSPTLVSGGAAFTSLAAGAFHVCGITSGGAAYCWGDNSHGQVGDGSTTDRNVPTLVSGSTAFTEIGAGFGHSCALTGADLMYCWGDNSSGQIGDGTLTQRTSPTAVLLP